MNANNRQVGGSHYAEGGEVQHWDFVTLNGLSYLVGCATKYIARWRKKNGVQDLEKALHYIEKLQELYTREQIAAAGKRQFLITVEEFCAANGIGGEEQEAIMALTYWASERDLGLAWEIVDGLIKQQG